MALMCPRRVPEDTESTAEKRLFDVIRRDLTDDWTVLHSLGMADHPRKPWAEIDFVLIGPPGIFCLEVKGGRVARREGRWYFTRRDDRITVKDEGPFEQVASAAVELRKYLLANSPELRGVAVGSGVVMPDIEFSAEAPDIDTDVLYDRRDRDRPFTVYLRRLDAYWSERLGRQRGRPVVPLTKRDVTVVVDELRGDFDLRPSLETQIGLANEELLRLTNEQRRLLENLNDFNERMVVRGGAGTGKTFLAVEEAKRQAMRGERVLYCCYNKRLALYVRQALRDYPSVDVHHLHGLMADAITEAGLNDRLPAAEADDLLSIFYPEMCVQALLDLDRVEVYDMLIVDEGQDLLRGAYLAVLDVLVKGCLSDGHWLLFIDPYQDIFHGMAPAGLHRLEATKPVRWPLSVNCRNTMPIAVATALLSGVRCENTLIVEGPQVEADHWYRDGVHQRRLISNCLNRLLSSGIRPSDIVVLSRLRRENGCLRDGLIGVPYPLTDIEDPTIIPDKAIRYATIPSFKGLEADAVLIADIDDLSRADAQLSVYVGTSRAKAFLALFFAAELKERYAELAAEYGRKLMKSEA